MADTKKAADEPAKAPASTKEQAKSAPQTAPAPAEDDDEDYDAEGAVKRLQARVRQLEKDVARLLDANRFRLPKED